MKIGTRVTWTSSGTHKEGVVTHVVPKGKLPADIGVPRLDNSGLPRDHESYVVRGQHVDRDGKPGRRRENYWPRVSLLTFHQDGPLEGIDRFVRALSAIATFPVSDPKNQDAANMSQIAMDALRWSVVPESEPVNGSTDHG